MRCEPCVEAILQLNSPRLARLLLEEDHVPERLSERLATDLDAGVALAATELLGRNAEGTKVVEASAGPAATDHATVDPYVSDAVPLDLAAALAPTQPMAPVEPTRAEPRPPDPWPADREAEQTSDARPSRGEPLPERPASVTTDDWGEEW